MSSDLHATEQEIQQELLKMDLDQLIQRLMALVTYLTSNSPIEVDAIDIINTTLDRIQNRVRKWDKKKCPEFKHFVFWAVKSNVNSAIKTAKNRKAHEKEYAYSLYANPKENNIDSKIDFEALKPQLMKALEEMDATIEEEVVFDCWLDGITEPRKIVELNDDLTIKDVNKATKRLLRKRPAIQKQFKPYFDGR